ncbi:response regulator [Sulfurimonas sp.]|nr:response regulator [Sulfurimonas sp.]
MSTNKKLDVLFIEDNNSVFDSDTKIFDELFNKVDKVKGDQKALKLIQNNKYDVIIDDMSVDPVDGTTFMKQIKEMKPELVLVSLILGDYEEKIGDIIEFGVHAFVLTPEQFEPALEAISKLDTSPKPEKKLP